jgi:hypothetical protein
MHTWETMVSYTGQPHKPLWRQRRLGIGTLQGMRGTPPIRQRDCMTPQHTQCRLRILDH